MLLVNIDLENHNLPLQIMIEGENYSMRALDLSATKEGGFILVGWMAAGNAYSSHQQALLLSINADKELAWVKTFNDANFRQAHSIEVLSGGNYIISGLKMSKTGNTESFIGEIDSAGKLKAIKAYLIVGNVSNSLVKPVSSGGMVYIVNNGVSASIGQFDSTGNAENCGEKIADISSSIALVDMKQPLTIRFLAEALQMFNLSLVNQTGSLINQSIISIDDHNETNNLCGDTAVSEIFTQDPTITPSMVPSVPSKTKGNPPASTKTLIGLSDTWAYVVGATSFIVLGLFVTAGFVCLCSSRKREKAWISKADENDKLVPTKKWVRIYRDKVLGRGGAGVVYEGTSEDKKHSYAIKMYSQGTEECHVIRSFNILRSCQADNLIKVHYLVLDSENIPGIVMEKMGISLKKYLQERKGNKLDLQAILRIAGFICDGLTALHTPPPHLAHCDLKNSNVLIAGEGMCKEQVKITDIDLSMTDDTFNEVTENTLAGTKDWMAPERSSGLIYTTQALDIWPLGLILISLYTLKEPPFDDNDLNSLQPEEFRELVKNCTKQAPEQRPDITCVSKKIKEMQGNENPEAEEVLRQEIGEGEEKKDDNENWSLAVFPQEIGGGEEKKDDNINWPLFCMPIFCMPSQKTETDVRKEEGVCRI